MVRAWVLCALAAMLGGCAAPVDVRTEYDRNIDFSKYKTFGFATGKVLDRPGYEPVDKARLEDRFREAARNELEQRGMDYVTDDADLIVTYTAGAQKKEDLVRTSPSVSYSGVGGYDAPGAWRPAGWHTDVDEQFWTRQYVEGTLLVDIYDARTRQPVWKSYSVTEIPAQDSQKNRAAEVIAKALKGFPPK